MTVELVVDQMCAQGCGPVGLLPCAVPVNTLGNIPSVGLHPSCRASRSVSSQPFLVTGGICKQGIRHRNTGAMVLL